MRSYRSIVVFGLITFQLAFLGGESAASSRDGGHSCDARRGGYVRVLSRFFDAWADRDVDRIVRFFAKDAVYNNVPFPAPAVGRAEIRALLESYIPLFSFVDLGAETCIVDGNIVATARTDIFTIASSGRSAVFPIAGIFYFDAFGQITRWDDYFDARTFERQSGMPLP